MARNKTKLTDLSLRIPTPYFDRARPVIRPYVYPVFLATDSRCFDANGSCVFITYNRRYFLVTAAHVWLDLNKAYNRKFMVFNVIGPDSVGGEHNFVEIPGVAVLSDNAGKKDDNIDLAVIELEESWWKGSGFSAVPERLFATERNDDDLHRIIHGFTAAQNPKYITGGKALYYPRTTMFFEEKMINFDWSAVKMYSSVENIPTPYQIGKRPIGASRFSRLRPDSSKRRPNQVSSKPSGMSGGAVWSTPSIYLNPTEFRLAGISITQEKIGGEIITFATKFNKVLELIDTKM